MANPQRTPGPSPEPRDSFVGDVIELREEDTVPAKRPESYRTWLEQKYGRRAPPPKPPADEQK